MNFQYHSDCDLFCIARSEAEDFIEPDKHFEFMMLAALEYDRRQATHSYAEQWAEMELAQRFAENYESYGIVSEFQSELEEFMTPEEISLGWTIAYSDYDIN